MLMSAPFDATGERGASRRPCCAAPATCSGATIAKSSPGSANQLARISPHVRLAWTWFGPADTAVISPQVWAGPAADYARRLVIKRNRLAERGPAFQALAGRRAEPFNVSAHALFGPWREAASAHGVRTAPALPLPCALPGGSGLFVVYADSPGCFQTVGVGLFESLAELFGSVLSLATGRSGWNGRPITMR